MFPWAPHVVYLPINWKANQFVLVVWEEDMRIRGAMLSATAAVLVLGMGAAQAAPELIVNGGFEQVAQQGADPLPTSGSFEFGDTYKYGQAVVGWTSTTAPGASAGAFNIRYGTNPTTVNPDTRYPSEAQHLWTLPSNPNPDGGAFVGLDGDVNARGVLSQTVNGLTVGQKYDLTFSWAAAQLADRSGDTTELLRVAFGGDTFDTALVNNPSHSASDWMTVTHQFTATSTSQTLSFLSIGTPTGLPPMALLDGVSLTAAVPEPATWGMMIFGFGLVGGALRRRSRSGAVSATA